MEMLDKLGDGLVTNPERIGTTSIGGILEFHLAI